MLADLPIAEVLREVIEEVDAELNIDQPVSAIPRVVERTLAFLSCRSAIKAGDVLTIEERRNIPTKLLSTTTQYTCPHGRPTQVELSVNQLERLFHRK